MFYNRKRFPWIPSNLKKLKKMSFDGDCCFLYDESIFSLLNSQYLEEIQVKTCNHHVTGNAIGYAMRNCPKLASLTLTSLKKSPQNSLFSVENSIAYAKNLHTLCFYEMNMSNEILCSITKANPPLRKLALSQTQGGESLSMIIRVFCSLEELHLTNIQLTDDNIHTIAQNITKLTRIHLSCSYLDNRCFFLLTNSCPLLEEISMNFASVGVGDISRLKLRKHDKMQNLSLHGNKYLDDETLEIIARICSNLQILSISCCSNVTGEGIREVFKSCAFLTHLDITNTKASNLFGKFPKDRIVNLKVFRAQGIKLNDEAMGVIGKICPLEFLDVGLCIGLTKIGVMEVVKNCKKLERIDLTQCENVSIDDLNIMVRTRPSLNEIILCPKFLSEAQKNCFQNNYGCKILNGYYESW